tara:strand:- start:95 stop:379 length:285 start_codon:yes stop_codon:yes gene_type:complete
MNFYKKAIFSFILVVFFFVIAVKLIEPVIDRQIKNSISDKKLSEKLKKELQNSVEDFTPEKREFYKQIIKKSYKKWKPLIDEALNEANKELNNN